MKYYLCAVILLLTSVSLYAIRPSSSYSNTPAGLNLNYEELKLNTNDGASINVWHLPSEAINTPVVIALSDAGNMGDWLYLGMYLQAYGLDVWMFDYRGFGSSSSFNIDQGILFYPEFITDLATVCDYVYQKNKKAPALLGLSMGTIILNEYIKDCRLPISCLIFDGYVRDPEVWVKRLAQMGKDVKLPKDYQCSHKRYRQDCLFVVEEKDSFFMSTDIPRPKSKKTTIKTYDCDHISAFASYPREYAEMIQQFIYSHES